MFLENTQYPPFKTFLVQNMRSLAEKIEAVHAKTQQKYWEHMAAEAFPNSCMAIKTAEDRCAYK